MVTGQLLSGIIRQVSSGWGVQIFMGCSTIEIWCLVEMTSIFLGWVNIFKPCYTCWHHQPVLLDLDSFWWTILLGCGAPSFFRLLKSPKKQSIERSSDEGTAWNPKQSFVVLVPVSLLKSLFSACNFCCLNPCNFHRICRQKFCRQVPSGTSSLSQGGSHQDGPGQGKTADVVPLSIGNQPSKNANRNITRGHTNHVD
jgi:hypothetical protein